jgi:6-phosphogluconolactonase (cycloisomerase 2 family)
MPDGDLTFISYSGRNYFDQGFNVMRSPAFMLLSPDSSYLYVSALSSNNIVVFSIDYDAGALNFVQAVRDSGYTGADNRLLTSPYHLALSPNGNHLYVCGYGEDGMAVLSRSATTGMLTYLPANNITGYYSGDMRFTAIPADKKNLYLSDCGGSSIIAFNRNITTGELTPFAKYTYSSVPTDPTYQVTRSATDLVISPDDKNLYVSTQTYKRISVYSRDLTTGALTFVQTDSAAPAPNSMATVFSLMMSPDGKHIYVGDIANMALYLFSRNAADGRVTFVAKYPDSTLINQNLKSPYFGTFNSTGAYLYVPAYGSRAVTVFSRNATDGTLTCIQSVVDTVNLLSPTFARLSSDNNFLYVTAYTTKAINVFSRDAVTGMLTLVQTLKDTINLNGAQPIAFNSTGTKVFVGARVNKSIAEFDRSTTTGQLTFVRSYVSLVDIPINGLYEPYGLKTTAEGHLYASNRTTGALTLFTIGATGISNPVNNPFDYHLYQNYPNPFNPVTTIKFTVPKAVEVTMKVYNALGQEVATILNNKLCSKGENVAIWNAGNFGSGVYFYVIKAGDYKAVKKMMLIK